mmetsp:Transcript_10746/g.33377  ORF Transcript_10746/g.33377 Transcript_10746/m.33377 type:complete len:150 (-) Transcript_10746:75-524(-)
MGGTSCSTGNRRGRSRSTARRYQRCLENEQSIRWRAAGRRERVVNEKRERWLAERAAIKKQARCFARKWKKDLREQEPWRKDVRARARQLSSRNKRVFSLLAGRTCKGYSKLCPIFMLVRCCTSMAVPDAPRWHAFFLSFLLALNSFAV